MSPHNFLRSYPSTTESTPSYILSTDPLLSIFIGAILKHELIFCYGSNGGLNDRTVKEDALLLRGSPLESSNNADGEVRADIDIVIEQRRVDRARMQSLKIPQYL